MATNSLKWLALLGGLAVGSASVAVAQDSGPLIDTLVKKGILTDQEGEDLRVELLKDFGSTSPGKLDISSSVTKLKISGDIRLRQQFESQTTTADTDVSNERTRTRFRFRLNGDFTLQNGWETGFALETAPAADSGNQTLENGADDYGIHLARAYVAYSNGDLLLVGGKQKNLLYTTDLLWDGDINPQGFTEQYAFHFGDNASLTLRAAQFLMDDNAESSGPTTSATDAWLFYQQAEYKQKLGKSSLTVAPGYFFYNASTLAGLGNEDAFNGTTENISVFVLPGDISFKVGANTVKVYGDLAYNFRADSRTKEAYARPVSDSDPLAWLVGVSYGTGTGKDAGNWKVSADYREIGLSSIDPNINDSDFAFSNLNQSGFKLGASYNLTTFATVNITYMQTEEMDSLTGAGPGIANLDSSDLFQLDLVVKF
ncbi:MAG: putative porin [Opitutaceae bacterium]|nr:putative porin [Opitutaceae bacterium]